MKLRFKILIVVAFLVISYGLLQIVPYTSKEGSDFIIEKGETPLVIAHGGAKLLNPENTILAFNSVYEMGVDVLEMDLCLTADNLLVSHHNLSIDDTSNGTGNVVDYTYEELSQFNFGYYFEDLDGNYPYQNESDEDILATLIPMEVQDIFDTYGTDILYIMEIKDSGEDGMYAAELLNEYIVANNMQEYVCVASFHEEVLAYFIEIKDPTIDVSMDLSTATDFIIANLVGYGLFVDFDYAGLQLPMEHSGVNLTYSYLIYKIHHNQMFVQYWTINDKEDMTMLIQRGADGIITDRPDLLFEVLEELGY